MKNKVIKKKKAAMEMSIGTIVILIIAIVMLIFGIILVRSIMCSGIQVTEQLNRGVMDQVRGLFGDDKYGVKCVGEGGQEIKFGTGGRRKIVCLIKTEDSSEYKINVKEIKSLKGASDSTVAKWVADKDWKGNVKPGGDGTEATVLLLDIPRDAPTTTLKITFESVKDNDDSTRETLTSYIDVVPAGFFRTTMC